MNLFFLKEDWLGNINILLKILHGLFKYQSWYYTCFLSGAHMTQTPEPSFMLEVQAIMPQMLGKAQRQYLRSSTRYITKMYISIRFAFEAIPRTFQNSGQDSHDAMHSSRKVRGTNAFLMKWTSILLTVCSLSIFRATIVI